MESNEKWNGWSARRLCVQEKEYKTCVSRLKHSSMAVRFCYKKYTKKHTDHIYKHDA